MIALSVLRREALAFINGIPHALFPAYFQQQQPIVWSNPILRRYSMS